MSRSRLHRPRSGEKRSTSSKIRPPPRASTSLGFVQRRTLPVALEPQGFDVRSYLRQRGPAAGIIVGINGRPSGDRSLREYINGCRRGNVEETESSAEAEVEEGKLTEREQGFRDGSRRFFPKPVPLCWKEQISDTSSVTRVLFSIAGEHNHQPPKPVHVSKDEAVESLVCALRGAHRMITVGVDCLAPWSSENGLLLDLQAALTTHSPSPSPPPARSPSPRSDLAARLSPQLDSCCAELQFELLPALLGCEARDLPEHFPRLHSLLCIWFTAAETSYLDQDVSCAQFEVTMTFEDTEMRFPELQLERVTPSVCVVSVNGVSRNNSTVTNISLLCSGKNIFTQHLSGSLAASSHTYDGSLQVSERFFYGRENISDQEEDEDRTNMRDIAQNFPDLQVFDFDGGHTEEEEEEEENEEEEEGLAPLAVYITPQGTCARHPISLPSLPFSCPPSSSLHSSSLHSTATYSFSGIVRQHLHRYLN